MELETFKIIVVPLREKMYNLSCKFIEDKDDAEDIVQEAFLRLWHIRHKLDEYRSVEALAMQITKNLAFDRIKASKRIEHNLETLPLISDLKNPAEAMEQTDAVNCIRRLIENLPTLQQTIVRMKDIEGYELNEIAEITGSQIESIRVNLSRARKRVREQFLALNK